MVRSSHQRCSLRKSVLKNFEKASACNFIKKETLSQMFSCEFCEISKNTFLQNTSGQLLLNGALKKFEKCYRKAQEKVFVSKIVALRLKFF